MAKKANGPYPSQVELVDISAADHDFTATTLAISFGTAGALVVKTDAGQVVTIPSGALAAGVQHSLRIIRVYKTGTTAADIVGYY